MKFAMDSVGFASALVTVLSTVHKAQTQLSTGVNMLPFARQQSGDNHLDQILNVLNANIPN